MRDVEHVGAAQRIPGVHGAVLAEGDVDAVGAHLRHARHAAALRIGVVAALQHDVDQRVGDRVHARLGDQRQELRDVVIVHGVHGGEVRAGDAALQAEPLRLVGQRLDVARQRVVGLVAMDVDEQPALFGDLAERLQARRRRPPSCARNAGCRRPRRRPCRARARDSSRRSASENSRPAGRRRAAGRYRARCVFFTSSSASTAVSRSSQMSTCVRMASRPFDTARSQ